MTKLLRKMMTLQRMIKLIMKMITSSKHICLSDVSEQRMEEEIGKKKDEENDKHQQEESL